MGFYCEQIQALEVCKLYWEKMNAIDLAKEIIYGDREETYGHPSKNLVAISQLWTIYLHQKYGVNVIVNAEDVCWMMNLLKMTRQMNKEKQDNVVDAIGYLALIDRLGENK
jgi:hypothetical protein